MMPGAEKRSISPEPSRALVTWRRRSLAVGLVASAVLAVGGFFDPAQFFRTYLSAYVFFFGLAMGSLAPVMIYHVTGGAWGFLVRHLLEAALGTLPLVAVGFLPVALGMVHLYPWAQPGAGESNDLIRFQQQYMNPAFFCGRAAIAFALWLTIAWLLSAWSRAEDRTGNPRYRTWCENLSGPSLVIFGVTMHFETIDWLLSLEPAFHSTIWGPLVVSGELLSAQALAVVMLTCLRKEPALAERISPKAVNDLGNLLLSFVVVSAYMWWFQFMLIWIANLPVDVVWYMPRMRNGWQWVMLALVLFGFAVPLVSLLWRAVKQNPRAVRALAALVIAMQYLASIYLVEPGFPTGGILGHWMDVVAPIALGGIWLTLYLWRLGSRPLVPLADINEASALRLRTSDEEEQEWGEVFSHG